MVDLKTVIEAIRGTDDTLSVDFARQTKPGSASP